MGVIVLVNGFIFTSIMLNRIVFGSLFRNSKALGRCRQIHTTVRKQGGDIWYYREPPPSNPTTDKMVEYAGAFVWWWVFWHLYHDYGHITGHFPMPDPSKWTDAELGIPPDDAD